MRKTEKKFWYNGHKKYGKKFHTLSFRFFNIGVIICNNGIEFYKLV